MSPAVPGDESPVAVLPAGADPQIPAGAAVAVWAAPVVPVADPPVMSTAAPTGSLDTATPTTLVSWLGGDNPAGPAAAPLAWAALAVSRRDPAAAAPRPAPTAVVSTGQPLDPTLTGGAPAAAVPAAAAVSAAAVGNPITDLIRFFVGDGTAENPNAGILFGNGYSYTATPGPAPPAPATAATAA